MSNNDTTRKKGFSAKQKVALVVIPTFVITTYVVTFAILKANSLQWLTWIP